MGQSAELPISIRAEYDVARSGIKGKGSARIVIGMRRTAYGDIPLGNDTAVQRNIAAGARFHGIARIDHAVDNAIAVAAESNDAFAAPDVARKVKIAVYIAYVFVARTVVAPYVYAAVYGIRSAA